MQHVPEARRDRNVNARDNRCHGFGFVRIGKATLHGYHGRQVVKEPVRVLETRRFVEPGVPTSILLDPLEDASTDESAPSGQLGDHWGEPERRRVYGGAIVRQRPGVE